MTERETAASLAAAATGIAFGVILFLAPSFLIGGRGLSFGYLIAWAMAVAPGSRALFDAGSEARVIRSLGSLLIHAASLTFLFSPIFLLGRMTARG